MSARYLIRLDDACPTMHRKNWERVENLLNKYEIKPLVAVIPNNKRDNLLVDEPMEDFWEKVKGWESKDWTICMHGFDHVYETSDGGLVPIIEKSEFAGVPVEKQREKIKKAWEIFIENDLKPKAWVAPAHSFDENTLKVLKEETEIDVVSDGIALSPFYEKDFYWIPTQLWRFRKFPFGLWTITLHPGNMEEKDFIKLEKDLELNRESFINFSDIRLKKRQKNLFDKVFSFIWWKKMKEKQKLFMSKSKRDPKVSILINSIAGRQAVLVGELLGADRLFTLEQGVKHDVKNRPVIRLTKHTIDTSPILKTLYVPIYALKFKKHIDPNQIVISYLERANFVNIIASMMNGHKTIISERTTPSVARFGSKGFFVNTLIKWLYPKADLIVVCSQGVKNDLIDKYGIDAGKIEAIKNPFPIEKIREKFKEEV